MIGKTPEFQLRFDLPGLDEDAQDAADRAISLERAREISEAARLALELVETQGAGLPLWWSDYLKLRQMGWPWRVASYIAWASSPRHLRWPETLQSLATDVLGLTRPRVIYTWREKYPSIDAVVAVMQAAPLWEHRRDVFQALVEMARQPDYKSFNDRKLFLEMTGDYTPKSRMDLMLGDDENDPLVLKNDKELRQVAKGAGDANDAGS